VIYEYVNSVLQNSKFSSLSLILRAYLTSMTTHETGSFLLDLAQEVKVANICFVN